MTAAERRARLGDALPVYAITPDAGVEEVTLVERVDAACAAGLRIVQLRRPSDAPDERLRLGHTLREVTRAHGALLVINDDLALARAVDADGVHLGERDLPIREARDAAPGLLIGASARSLDRARQALAEGADLLGVGAIFDARATKADASAPQGLAWLAELRRHLGLAPLLVAIGGVDASNAGACAAHGANGVAVVRALLGEPDAALAFARIGAAFHSLNPPA